jgi:hypothetical protein
MTDLHIALLSASTTAQDEPRVRRLLVGVTERRLAPALAGLDLPPGEWCVHRLDVPLLLGDQQADGTVEVAWARALAAAVRAALEHGPDAGVVHYRRPAAALADLLASLAIGNTERLWAWRQLGVLQAGDPDPAGMPVAAALTALRRQPADTMPALVAAGRTAGVAALHRLLGPAGWNELARLVIASLGGDPALAIPPGSSGAAGVRARPSTLPTGPVDGPAGRPAAVPPTVVPPAATRLAGAIVRRSVLGQAVARSRLRPDQVTAWAWAALAAAEVEPALFFRPAARSVLALLAAGYRPDPPTRPGASAQRADEPESADLRRLYQDARHGAQSRRPDAADLTTRPAVAASAAYDQTLDRATHRPDPRPGGDTGLPAGDATGSESELAPAADRYGWPTDWAGLPFFLVTAEQAGLPAALLADEVLAGRPLSWTVYQLGRRLVPVIDSADPALFALAGLIPAPAPLEQPTPAESDRLAIHAKRWVALTAARLSEHRPSASEGGAERSDSLSEHRPSASEDLATVAEDLAARPGVVFAEPGWIEIHLALEGVRLDVRRAGLDVDPGWLRWLTAVVSFVYE